MERQLAETRSISVNLHVLAPPFQTSSESRRHTQYSFFKRVVDTGVSLPLLCCAIPLISVAAILIYLESGGSSFFRQQRIGVNGKTFWLLKLRTMYEGSHTKGFLTVSEDCRVTVIGNFLRQTKLDELPQLWHVLCGEMSLVGPRPLSVEETDYLVEQAAYSPITPGLVPRVLPGMTGLEQCTRSSLHPYDHRFQLNSYYEDHQSIWLDLWILKRTVFVCPMVCSLLCGCALMMFWLASLAL